jgi:hypothetical protein
MLLGRQWHRNIGELGKRTRRWAACFSDPAKHVNFWDMAIALVNKLASFNIMVEKWDSSKIAAARGANSILGNRERPRVKLHDLARAGTSDTRAAAQDAAGRAQSRIKLQACRLPRYSSGSSPDTDGGAL